MSQACASSAARNLYLTYDFGGGQTQLALFYTVQGDTLVSGAGLKGVVFVPNVYQKEFGTLNLSLSRVLGKHFKLQLQAKNLTNPDIEEVYRSEFIGGDVSKASYSKGSEVSLSLSVHL
ncbi:MAG: hypothetical protein EXS08_15690 [Planctomycetes bacterium]|nr:hypothetical protein [Planctomycetota bacterium]